MRIIALLVTILVLIVEARAQIVTEEVHFDYYQSATDNDFVNHFSGGYGMSQIQTNGITGGCLLTPDSISWGNDNAIYCSYYKPQTGDSTVTAISFKYDSTTVHINSFQRAMSIFLRPWADFNHYIIASVSGNKKIELLTYGWNNNPYPLLALHHNHWYRYILTVIFQSGDQISVNAEVLDLGISGTDVPTIVNSSSGSFIDNVLSMDTAIQVSVTGATYGGAIYLDDFLFNGREGMTNCINIPTSIQQLQSTHDIQVYPSIANHEVFVEIAEAQSVPAKCEIINLSGKRLMEVNLTQPKNVLDVRPLPPGRYVVHVISPLRSATLPLVIAK